jgi:hypothetical protein
MIKGEAITCHLIKELKMRQLLGTETSDLLSPKLLNVVCRLLNKEISQLLLCPCLPQTRGVKLDQRMELLSDK